MQNPEISRTVQAAGIATNYHDEGSGPPVLLLHGSGPGVTAWANWRLIIGPLARTRRVVAPDLLGFGYTERPASMEFSMDKWLNHLTSFMDALGLERVDVVGNSFGGALAMALAVCHPERVGRMVLMGSGGAKYPITPGLEAVWGYEPSLESMKNILDIFAYDRTLVTDELAELRYQASIRPGFQEAFSAMFPAPRQRWVDALALYEDKLPSLPHETLLIHGRDDRVVPVEASLKLSKLIPNSQLHIFGRCGHWTQIEKRQQFLQLVENFLAEPASLAAV